MDATPDAPPRVNPTLEIDSGGVGWLRFDDPDRSMNVFSAAVLEALGARLDEAEEAARAGTLRRLVLWSDKPGSFFAGADIDTLSAVEDPGVGEAAARTGQDVFERVAAFPVPTLAAIDGTCLGGGLEISLACDYRVASDSARTKIGLPEVQLGIVPAWGGSTRLPRLVGLRRALDLILTGRQVDGRRAKRMGLVDELFPAELFHSLAGDFIRAREKPHRSRPGGVIGALLEGNPVGRAIVLRTARKNVMAKTGGHYPAPLRALEIVKRSYGRAVPKGLALEAAALGELIVSPVSKNLVHLFHLREAARKGAHITGLDEAPPVKRLGVLGAGVMGGEVAQLAAYRGMTARIKDIRHEAVTGALQHAKELFDKAVGRRRLTKREAREGMERVSGGLDYAGFGAADVVVEAVVERLDVKKAVLAEVEAVMRSGGIISSNTSSLSITEMATALDRPDRFCGIHFFNPVHRMPLVEVVRGSRTSHETVATAYAFALALGKVPVVVNDGAGFLVNRILGPYLNEAAFLLGEGCSIETIDRAGAEFGMPMGPLRLVDEIGIDIARHAGESLHAAFGERMRPSPVLEALGSGERLGRKGGRGFYLYEKGKETGIDPQVYAELAGVRPAGSTEPDADDVRARLVLAMVNEAARTLDDGIVSRAGDLDLAMIMGTGFPPFRGGLLRFADSLHIRSVSDRLSQLQERVGERFAPAPLIQELARRDQGFYAAYP